MIAAYLSFAVALGIYLAWLYIVYVRPRLLFCVGLFGAIMVLAGTCVFLARQQPVGLLSLSLELVMVLALAPVLVDVTRRDAA
jgi:hypothetical protein